MVSVNRDQYCVVRRNVKWEPLKRAIIWLGYSGSVRWRRRRLDEKEICGNRYAYSLYRDWLVWWAADEGILGRMQMMRWENDRQFRRSSHHRHAICQIYFRCNTIIILFHSIRNLAFSVGVASDDVERALPNRFSICFGRALSSN